MVEHQEEHLACKKNPAAAMPKGFFGALSQLSVLQNA